MAIKFHIRTLGCKINQFDASLLAERLTAGGARRVSEGEAADVYVVQTCTVTARSDYHCRQAIRRAAREKPQGAKLVVTGCYAQTSPESVSRIPGVDMVVGNDGRDGLPAMLMGAAVDTGGAVMRASTVCGRSRASLKVQEGCGHGCSYCIVPAARGASVSAPLDDVLDKARGLAEDGFYEIVLTGVHLGAYGMDTGGPRLSGLIEALLATPGLGRLRLSSVEPMEVDDNLVSLICKNAAVGGRLCRHFHLPLQSGDDQVLSSMGRGYTWADYLRVVERLADGIPGSLIGADVIVGYPTEDDESFETTYRRIGESPINYLHVFSYSPRPGTKAHALGDPVQGIVKRERNRRLRELAAMKNLAFREGFVGGELTIVAEHSGGAVSGLTDNYIRVAVDAPCEAPAPGSPARVRITDVRDRLCKGVLA